MQMITNMSQNRIDNEICSSEKCQSNHCHPALENRFLIRFVIILLLFDCILLPFVCIVLVFACVLLLFLVTPPQAELAEAGP